MLEIDFLARAGKTQVGRIGTDLPGRFESAHDRPQTSLLSHVGLTGWPRPRSAGDVKLVWPGVQRARTPGRDPVAMPPRYAVAPGYGAARRASGGRISGAGDGRASDASDGLSGASAPGTS